ncbi:MAG: hypothetical protein ACE5JG_02720 [Planctomycetota bacterium]
MRAGVAAPVASARIAAWAELLDLGAWMAYEALLAATGDAEVAVIELRARLRREDEERRSAKRRVLDGLARAV